MASIRVRLEICGSSYVVSTTDSEDYMLKLAERLDHDMNEMMMNSPNASVTAAAVVTALAYLDDAEKSASSSDNMRGQIQGYLEDAAKARLAAEEARREVDRLRKELAFYEGKSRPTRQAEPLLNYGQGRAAAKGEAKAEAGEEQMPGQMGMGEV